MEKIKVKIVNKSNHQLPFYATDMSAGMDLKANTSEPIVLGPLERALIPTGIHIQLPEGYEAQIRARSGLAAKYGITVCNGPATIDADFTGELKIILINLSNDKFVVNPGERVAQMIVSKHEKVEWKEFASIEEFDETERGEKGFGSTGNN